MDDKLTDARLREIEDWLRGYGPVSLEYAETLTAEIRRLRGMVAFYRDGIAHDVLELGEREYLMSLPMVRRVVARVRRFQQDQRASSKRGSGEE